MPEVHPNPPGCLKKAQQDHRVLHGDFFRYLPTRCRNICKPPYEISFAFSRTRHLIYVFFVAPAICRDVDRHDLPRGTARTARICTTSFPLALYIRNKVEFSLLLYRKLNVIDYQNIHIPVLFSKNGHRFSNKSYDKIEIHTC